MKTLKFIFAAAALTMLLSFTAPLSKKMGNYVAKVERECAEWTKSDWEKSRETFNSYIDEFEKNYATDSSEEKDAIYKSIGKYKALLLKHKINKAEGALKEFGERVPSLVEGFMSAFE